MDFRGTCKSVCPLGPAGWLAARQSASATGLLPYAGVRAVLCALCYAAARFQRGAPIAKDISSEWSVSDRSRSR